jgi:hypothetical protein
VASGVLLVIDAGGLLFLLGVDRVTAENHHRGCD